MKTPTIRATRGFILASLLAMAMIITGSSIVLSTLAQDQGTNIETLQQPNEPPWMSQLTDEQKAELQQMLDSPRETGATHEETMIAISAKLEEWGIDIPEPNDQQRPEPEWMSQLTDEQKVELQQLMDSLKASGARPETRLTQNYGNGESRLLHEIFTKTLLASVLV